MWAEIRTDDHVRLKTGGPVMVVEAKDDNDGAYCVWLDGEERKKQRFLMSDLEKTDDSFAGEGDAPVRE